MPTSHLTKCTSTAKIFPGAVEFSAANKLLVILSMGGKLRGPTACFDVAREYAMSRYTRSAAGSFSADSARTSRDGLECHGFF